MYNGIYDEYIRSILGYPPNNLYNDNYTRQNVDYNFMENNYTETNNEIEKSYPEIYKIVYPMIVKKCNNLMRNVRNEDIENMTDEIYFALEGRNVEKNNRNKDKRNDRRT